MPSFALIGVDAFLFNIDPLSGLITLRDWFMPDAEDPWDADQDGTYDFAVEVTQDDGTVEVFPAGLDVAPDGSVTLTITHDVVEVDESGSELDDALRPDLTGDVLDSPDLPERITPQPETEANPGEVITGDMQPTGNELLVNGQLNYDVPNGRWTQTDQVEGWSNDNGNVEAWTDGFLGANSADGSGILELDVRSGGQVDTLSQTVETQAGSEITLSFSAAQRGSDNDSIEVYWRGELIDTVTPSEGNDFETFEFTVTGSGGEDVLEFRELASENDGTGPLFDNISLVEHEMVEVELLQNSELNNDLTNGRYGFRSENDGWTNSNGSVEVWADGFLGADSGDGTGITEL
ncbi:hypothetical protein, partial [Planktotalea sp.]|uniref:hypothetical protein n=1 Tax=Planktotalea sp. TaxID=2029877 RepID=UPI003297BCC9